MIFLDFLIMVLAFLLMEGVAWSAHRYVMHGLLWTFHKDHHKKESKGFFEHNDFFFLIFAIPGIVCLYVGVLDHFSFVFWIGLGITLYGFAYFFVHDIFIHQRFRLFRNTNNPYLKAIRRAHKAHHKNIGKDEGQCFGMLWVPRKYFRNEKPNDLL